MLYEERLGGKHIIKPKIVIEMIQLIAGSKDFYSVILKIKFGVQEMISSDSLHKILISSTPWMQKQIKKKKKVKDSKTKLFK